MPGDERPLLVEVFDHFNNMSRRLWGIAAAVGDIA
jgi:hypothetical protein